MSTDKRELYNGHLVEYNKEVKPVLKFSKYHIIRKNINTSHNPAISTCLKTV